MPDMPALNYAGARVGELHPNVIVGTTQLLGWLTFHPTAWRAYVARLDPQLAPSFGLLDLTGRHWREPLLRRLMLQVYLVLPLLVGGIVGLALLIRDPAIPLHLLVSSMTLSVLGGLFIMLEMSAACVALSVPFGFILGIFAGIMSDLAGVFIFGENTGPAPAVFLLTSLAIGGVSGLLLRLGGRTAGLWSDHRPRPRRSRSGISGLLRLIAREIAGMWSDNPARPLDAPEQAFAPREDQRRTQRVIRILAGVILATLAFALVFAFSLSFSTANQAYPVEPLRLALTILVTLSFGGAIGWVISLLRGHRQRWQPAVLLGLVLSAAASIPIPLIGRPFGDWVATVPTGALFGLLVALTNGIPLGIVVTVFYVTGQRVSSVPTGARLGALGGGVAWLFLVLKTNPGFPVWLPFLLGALGALGGWALVAVRPFLLFPLEALWSVLLYQLDAQNPGRFGDLWSRHAAFWDEFQSLPLPRLDQYIVLVMERNPAEGAVMLDAVSTGQQRWAAQAAQLELDALRLERCGSVEAIAAVYRGLTPGELDSPIGALLRSFSRISHDIDAALQQESSFNQRLTLRAAEDRLDELLRELNRSNEAYAQRFGPIARQWRQLVADHSAALAQLAELRQEIDSPYVIGVPLTEQQEIFVGRTDTSARLERIVLDPRPQPLLLYGQRRMGKTSLLNNLGRLLPSTIVPFFVDLQGPASRARDEAGFLYNLVRGMSASAQRHRSLTLPPLAREALTADPFTVFDEWYDAVETVLAGQTALLVLDEFEVLEPAFAEGRFKAADILGMLRYMLQHRPNFKILLAGSHVLDELQSWSSYLINVQVLKLGYLQEAAARQLIERPVNGFALRYESAAVQRVLELTRGHPFLLQLLCAEIVAHKNQQAPADRWLVTPQDVAAVIPDALHHGSFFFGDLERNQLNEAAVAILRFLAAQGENAVVDAATLTAQFSTTLDQAIPVLLRRDVIEPWANGYRMQVELLRRWFDPTAA